MPKLPRKGTKARRIVEWRLRGLSNKEVAEVTGYNANECKVAYSVWKNQNRYREYQRNYYMKNKNKIIEYQLKRYRNLDKEAKEELWYRQKLSRCGVREYA